MSKAVRSRSLTYRIPVEEAKSLAETLAKQAEGGEVFALVGPLGSGKTTFAKHFGRALGIKANISSPTFILMQEYPAPFKTESGQPVFLYHLDLYRAHSPADVAALGLNEIWEQPNTITLIEWADKIKPLLPKKSIFIHFRNDNLPHHGQKQK